MRAVVLHSKMAVRRLQRHGREIRARGAGRVHMCKTPWAAAFRLLSRCADSAFIPLAQSKTVSGAAATKREKKVVTAGEI